MPHPSAQRATPTYPTTCPTKRLLPLGIRTQGLRSRNPLLSSVTMTGRSLTRRSPEGESEQGGHGSNSCLDHTLLRSLAWILFAALIAPTQAQNDFSARFAEIKKSASDEQLYRFLYDLPKGGDLHNHQDGAVWPEWWYQIATDPVKTHGDTFYTRTKILDSKISPLMYY